MPCMGQIAARQCLSRVLRMGENTGLVLRSFKRSRFQFASECMTGPEAACPEQRQRVRREMGVFPMHSRAGKDQSSHNRAMVNRASRRLRRPGAMPVFADNRPETRQLMRMQQSADRSSRGPSGLVAQLLREPGSPGLSQGAEQSLSDPDLVQRQELMEDEELLQGKFELVQRQAALEEEEELLQGKFAGAPAQPTLQRAEDDSGNRTGMPDQLKTGLEQLSGFDLSGVRVHYNSEKPAQLNALAYAQGQQIHLGPGQERPCRRRAWPSMMTVIWSTRQTSWDRRPCKWPPGRTTSLWPARAPRC